MPDNHEHKDDILVRFHDDGINVTLLEAICYDVFGVHYEVPEEFTCDFSSIPLIFRSIIPKDGKHRRAGILHDWLYKTGLVSRALADKVFLEVMRQDGVAYWKRYSMYWGLRAGGWYVYNNYRKKEK